MRRTPVCLVAVVVASLAAGEPAPGQTMADSATIIAGARYAAGGLHRLLLGRDYRDLWTSPLRVPVLDLGTFGGGLTPLRRGGGFQTRSLRFGAADGREYAFRSVDKDPSAILPPELRETLVDELVQDQISSGHPTGALAADPLLDAVGVLHPKPRLVVMPDDPRLGEFRAEFAGLLGLIEERPDEGQDTLPGFMGAARVIGTDRLLERLEEDMERVDARAFLAARLVDAFLGDWDRHRDQWRWARFGETRADTWKPIPRDRDQAFVRLDGLLLMLARQYFPQLVEFGDEYSKPLGLTWNGRELDRRLLVELDRPVWDSVATALSAALTDAAIDSAVARLPVEYRRLDGDRLARALRSRREGLPRFARQFYELLAGEVEVHTTDADEVVNVRLSADGADVGIVARTGEGASAPVFQRTFRNADTREIRLFLQGGGDSVHVSGDASPGIEVRVIGGGGDDVFVDDSRAGAAFYDDRGDNTYVRGRRTRVDERTYVFPGPPHSPSQPPRDWGVLYRFPLWVLLAPDIGLLAGVGIDRIDYGFRQWPFAWQMKGRAAFGTSAGSIRAEVETRINREASRSYWTVSARASGLEVLRFYGYGNETADDAPGEFFEVEQLQFRMDARLVLPTGARGTLALGPTVRYTDTDAPPDRLITTTSPYGAGAFGQLGVAAEWRLDGRDRPRAASRGAMLVVGGAWHPPLWDVREAFGEARAEATAFLTAPLPIGPTLALRAGGRKLWGEVPFSDAAYLGDDATVRLGLKQRYAGDAEAHANAELRLKLARLRLVLPADIGIFGLRDVGRVWYRAETSDRWHDATGGGVSIAFLRPENTLSLAVVKAEGRTGVYIGAGFAY